MAETNVAGGKAAGGRIEDPLQSSLFQMGVSNKSEFGGAYAYMKYKKVAVLFSLLVCVMIFGIVINTPEKRALRYFNDHRETLENDVLNCIETGRVSSDLNITFNYWDGEHPIIEYIVVSSGIVPASKYYGVFYSFDDEPVSFQNADEPLRSISEHEWEWNGEGDNHGIVRRLDTNWFYFEAAL